MTADMYLPVFVYGLPAHFIFQPDGELRAKIRRSVDLGISRVIAGPTAAHICIDVKRPYFKAIEAQP